MKTTPENALRELLKASKATAKNIKALEREATRPKPKKRPATLSTQVAALEQRVSNIEARQEREAESWRRAAEEARRILDAAKP
jgi:predicted  nucleic acid-binding Zn-ribbon protein